MQKHRRTSDTGNIPLRVVENSPLAWLARKINGWKAVGMTFGNHVHLSGATKMQFLKSERWMAHEMVHADQYKRYGFCRFLFLYLYEWVRKGYRQNRFEVEARERTEEFMGYMKHS